jgi:hypothetical protein
MRPVFDPAAVHRLKYGGAVDADGHLLEDAGLWDRYIERQYRERALRMKRRERAEYSRSAASPASARAALSRHVDGWARKISSLLPHPDKTYAANMPYGACDAGERLKLLDAEGLEAAGSSHARHPLGVRNRRRRAEPGLLPRLQPLDRRLQPRLGRPADPGRPPSLGDPAAPQPSSSAWSRTAPRRLRRALHLES